MNVYIVEDEIFHLEDLKISLLQQGHTCIGHSDDAFEAFEALSELSVDAVLMDIHLHERQMGIKLARKIKEYYQLPIIFTSSDQSQSIMEAAADIEPIAYLTKPINDGDLRAALIMASQKAKNDKSNSYLSEIFVKIGNRLEKVPTSSILFAHNDTKNYVTIVTKNKEYTFRNSISRFLKLLNPDEFIQTHRSYIVNLSHIQSVHDADQVIQINEHHIPVGRTFKAELYARIHIL